MDDDKAEPDEETSPSEEPDLFFDAPEDLPSLPPPEAFSDAYSTPVTTPSNPSNSDTPSEALHPKDAESDTTPQAAAPPPPTLRRRRSSSHSPSSASGTPYRNPSSKERRKKATLFALDGRERGGEDSAVSEVTTSGGIGAGPDREREIRIVSPPIPPPPPENSGDNTGILASGGVPPQLPQSSDLMLFLAGLVIKAVAFQVSLLISSIMLPFRVLTWLFLLLTDPFGTLKRAMDHFVRKLGVVFVLLRDTIGPVVLEWLGLGGQQGIGKVALRLGLGLFWSLYVGIVLLGCLVTAFLLGTLLMRRVTEEPVRIVEDLIFDYTKGSPVALVPITSCQCLSPGLECGGMTGYGKSAKRHLIPPNHLLMLTVFLTLPESEYNQKLGVFQVRAEFLSSNGSVTASASRPCMLQFKSYPIRLLETLLKTAPLLSGYTSESQVLRIKMIGLVQKTDPTACIRILIESRAEYRPGAGIPEIYAASLTLESELPLFRRIIWNWRRTIFIWISMVFFINELLVMLVCCRALIIPRRTPTVAP